MHDNQHERLRIVHPRDIALHLAEWRSRPDVADNAVVGLHCGHLGCRQRRSPDGLLLSDTLAHVAKRHARRNNGNNLADLHHYRHDRDGRECMVRLMRQRHGGTRRRGDQQTATRIRKIIYVVVPSRSALVPAGRFFAYMPPYRKEDGKEKIDALPLKKSWLFTLLQM